MNKSITPSEGLYEPKMHKKEATSRRLINASLLARLLLVLLVVFFLLTSVVAFFRAEHPFKQDHPIIAATESILVSILGFLFGYSLLVNIILGGSVLAALAFAIIIKIQMKRRRIPTYKRLWVAIAIPVITLLFVFFSVIHVQLMLYLCRRNTGIVFPSSTRLHWLQESWHFVGSETNLYMKVTMDRNDLLTFLQRDPIGIKIPNGQLLKIGLYGKHPFPDSVCVAKPFGWNPNSFKNCRVIEWQYAYAKYSYAGGLILINFEHPKKATVFLYISYH